MVSWLERAEAAERRRRRLAALDKIIAQHCPSDDPLTSNCRGCGKPWPCPDAARASDEWTRRTRRATE